MTIQAFDRQNLKQLRADMDVALLEVARKHGITVSLGSMRFVSDRVTCKVEANTAVQVAVTQGTVAPVSNVLQRAMTSHGVANLKGRKGETLTGYNPNRPKYPFSYQTIRGTKYKQTIEEARRMFGAA